MKALSIKQPFAHFIASGQKTIETRSWYTSHRGLILIVSSVAHHTGQYIKDGATLPCKDLQNRAAMAYGYALCIADLVECRSMRKSDEAEAMCEMYDGAYAWVLANVHSVQPFKVTGRLSLYEVDGKSIKPGERVFFNPKAK